MISYYIFLNANTFFSKFESFLLQIELGFFDLLFQLVRGLRAIVEVVNTKSDHLDVIKRH